MIRASLRGAEIERKIDTTADGSVVDTIAPISRHTTSGNALTQASAYPTLSVATTTATMASTRIGTQSSSIRRRFMPSVAWNSSVGRNT